MTEPDPFGFIDDEAEVLRLKHSRPPESRIGRELKRVSTEQNARERITRNVGPKMKIHDTSKLWTPR